ncbi:ABC transporter permease [Microtetraspora sp. AC03309]|uniref:ABC transporter permease n=1 Tax=Microtetraspora sp. AC03309 TaxID=2779376 RepID=UPI001E5461A5|nr:ABC transporter permease [Microtetraspora sp. AC03309]MCC5577512.1 ABC transporter permease [Microtetraspora sp. AC03309]
MTGAGARKEPPKAVMYAFLGLIPFLLVMMLVSVYTTSMHQPAPRDLPVAVIGTGQQAAGLADALNAADNSPVEAVAVESASEAESLLKRREIAAAFQMPTAAGGSATLYTAQAAGMGQASMMQAIFGQIAAKQNLEVEYREIAPLPAEDNMGVSAMMIVTAWILSGYMIITMITQGMPEAFTLRKTPAFLAVWAALMSAVVWFIADPVIGAVGGHAWKMLGLGWVTIFCVGLAQSFIARLIGPLGSIVGVFILMYLGVPASNLGMPVKAMPGFFEWLHGVLPTPAAGEALRAILYFGGEGVSGHLLVLALWGAVAAAGSVLLDSLRGRTKAAHQHHHLLTEEEEAAIDEATEAAAAAAVPV